jgi:hypothetical protein
MALTDNIRAAYNLDESSGNAADSSGNGYTLTNNNTVGFAAALINNGADFGTANTNKYFNIPTTGLGTTTGSYSISLWVKMRTEIASGVQYLFSWSGQTASTGFDIIYEYNSGTRRLNFRRLRSGVAFDTITHNITLGTSNWYNITVEYNSSSGFQAFVNNSSVGTNANFGNGSNNNIVPGFGIGAQINANTGVVEPSTYISAYMDIVYVWDRVLGSTDRTSFYNSGAGVQPLRGYNPAIARRRLLTRR